MPQDFVEISSFPSVSICPGQVTGGGGGHDDIHFSSNYTTMYNLLW